MIRPRRAARRLFSESSVGIHLSLLLLWFLPVASAESWTCSNCGTTYQFDSRDTAHRSNFIRSHTAVCKPSASVGPVNLQGDGGNAETDGIGRERELEERRRRLERAREIWVDLRAEAMKKSDAQKELYDAQVEMYGRRQIGIDLTYLRIQFTTEIQQVRDLKEAWIEVLDKAQAWNRDKQQLAEATCRAAFADLEELRALGLIDGAASSLPRPTPAEATAPNSLSDLPEEDRFERWIAPSARADKTWRDDYFARQIMPAVVVVEPIPEQPRTGMQEELDGLSRVRDSLRSGVEQLDARIRSTEEDTRKQTAGAAALRAEIGQMRDTLRGELKLVEYVKADVEQAATDWLIASAQEVGAEVIRKRIAELVPAATRESASMLRDDVANELSKVAPYFASLKKLKEYGDIMCRQLDEGGSVERIFAGIDASISLHYAPEQAEEARRRLNVAFHGWAGELRELGNDSQLIEWLTTPLYKADLD